MVPYVLVLHLRRAGPETRVRGTNLSFLELADALPQWFLEDAAGENRPCAIRCAIAIAWKRRSGAQLRTTRRCTVDEELSSEVPLSGCRVFIEFDGASRQLLARAFEQNGANADLSGAKRGPRTVSLEPPQPWERHPWLGVNEHQAINPFIWGGAVSPSRAPPPLIVVGHGS